MTTNYKRITLEQADEIFVSTYDNSLFCDDFEQNELGYIYQIDNGDTVTVNYEGEITYQIAE